MLKIINKLMLREIRMVTGDSSLVLTAIIAPILYAFMYCSIYINKVEDNVKVAIIDHDGTELSRQYTFMLDSDPMLEIIPVTDLDEAKELVNYDKAIGYVYIEKGFEEKILGLKQANVSLAVNSARFLPSSDLLQSVTTITLTMGGGVRLAYFSQQGMGEDEAMANTNPIQMISKPLFNPQFGYGPYLLPGLLAIILQQTILIAVAMSMSLERERGTFTEVAELSNYNFSNMLIGKSLFYLLSFLSFSLFFFYIVYYVFDISFVANMFEVMLMTLLFYLTLIPFGFFIGSFFKNPILVVQLMGFTSYPFFLISGYSMPFDNFPVVIQWLSDLLPTTPYLRVYTIMVQGGATLKEQLPDVLHLCGLATLYTLMLLWRYRHMRKKQAALGKRI